MSARDQQSPKNFDAGLDDLAPADASPTDIDAKDGRAVKGGFNPQPEIPGRKGTKGF